MDAALSCLAHRARTVREVERYLDEREYGEAEIMQVINRLEELGLLNDARFAADFVDSRLRTKPVSRRHLREQLYAHELPKELIDAALLAVPDDAEAENARAVAAKYAAQFSGLEPKARAQRVIKRLQARGYAYDVIREALEALALEADGAGADE